MDTIFCDEANFVTNTTDITKKPPPRLVLGARIPAIKQHPDTGGTGSEGVVEGGPAVLGCRALLTKGFCHYPPSFYF